MLKTISDYVANQLCNADIVSGEEKEIYSYGIHLTLMAVITCSTILFVGCYLEQLLVTILFLVSLAGLRHYTGGYHAQSYIKCYIISCLTYLVVILSILFLPSVWKAKITLGLGVTGCSGIWVMGSLNSVKNPKTLKEMMLRKWYAKGIAAFYMIGIGVGLICLSTYMHLWFTIACSLFITMVGMLIVKFKGGK